MDKDLIGQRRKSNAAAQLRSLLVNLAGCGQELELALRDVSGLKAAAPTEHIFPARRQSRFAHINAVVRGWRHGSKAIAAALEFDPERHESFVALVARLTAVIGDLSKET